jgi:hypothetical protein
MILILVAGLAAGVPFAPAESFASLSALISFVSTDYSSSRVAIFCPLPLETTVMKTNRSGEKLSGARVTIQ